MNTVVYYPHIAPNGKWLRIAALCWDTVHRLKPKGYIDPEPILELDSELGGVLRSVDPAKVARTGTLGLVFTEWLHGKHKELRVAPVPRTPTFTRFWPGKMKPSLVRSLLRDGLARWTSKNKEPDNFELRTDVADYYLSLVASQAAREKRRDILTPRAAFAEPVHYEAGNLSADVALAAMSLYLPKNIETIDPAKIRDVRTELREKRRAFQAEVVDLSGRFERLSSEGELTRIRTDAVNAAKAGVEDAKKIYRRYRLRTATKVMGASLSAPALPAFVASAVGLTLSAPASIAGAILLLGAELYRDHGRTRDEWKNNPWSYALDARKRLRR